MQNPKPYTSIVLGGPILEVAKLLQRRKLIQLVPADVQCHKTAQRIPRDVHDPDREKNRHGLYKVQDHGGSNGRHSGRKMNRK